MDDTISQSIPEKQCTKCEKPFPETPQYFHRTPKGRISFDRVTKLKEKCKDCCSIKSEKTKDREELKKQGKKRCNTCEQVFLATTEFFHSDVRPDRPNRSPIIGKCKECASKEGKENPYSQKNPENARLIKTRWRKNHPEQDRIIHTDWRRRNQPMKNTQTRNYRARAKEIPGTHTNAQILEKLKAQKYRCYYAACGFSKFEKRSNGTYSFHVDHTIPVARTEAMPRNDIDYLVLSCGPCNQSKNSKLPHEWPQGGRLF